MKKESSGDELLSQVKASLIALVKGMKESDTNTMLESMERLDGLVSLHRSTLNAQLAHFLERRSYAKALDFLSGTEAIARGTCAPKNS